MIRADKHVLLRLIRHGILLCGAVFMAGPFVWMVATSLKPKGEIFSTEFHLLPKTWGAVENYHTALTQVPLLHYLFNGAVVTVTIFVLQVLVNMPAAYALAKLRFRGRALMFGAVLFCLLIPYQAVALPIYIFFFKSRPVEYIRLARVAIHDLGVRNLSHAAVLRVRSG